MNVSSRKAQNVSIFAFILSLVFFIFTLIFGAYIQVLAVYLLSWQIFAGVMVWLVLLIQFRQRDLAEQEKLEMGRLSASAKQETIFTGGADRMAMLAVHQKRLAFVEKWIIPISGLLIAVYEVIVGVLLIQKKVLGLIEWDNRYPLLGAVLMVIVSFVSFLVSRYATGMSAEKEWKPLRAGGSYLMLTALVGFALAISQAFAQFKHPEGLMILNYVIPSVMILLGIEIVINAILDIYRPRVAGQYSRAAMDSQLLGLMSEPGGFLHTVAHTIDYQFGFKVSQTWFYQLLGKTILPLILFAALTLYLMSGVFVIGPGHAAIIEYFGSPVREAYPGIHLKWPWPIEKVYVYPTDEVQQISIGYKETEADKQKTAMLWGEKHYEEEYDVLVAVRTGADALDEGAVPVSVVKANVPIQYRISNLKDYLYNHKDAKAMLESICYRELTRFAVSAEIEMDEKAIKTTGQKSLLGAGRLEAANELKRRIQKAIDDKALGVEIVFLGMHGVHPPPEVAKEYEQVIASVQQKQATVLAAQADKNKILTQLAGSIGDVESLYALVVEYDRVKEQGDEVQIKQVEDQLKQAFGEVKGRVFQTLRTAQGDAFERASLAKGEGLRFQGQIKGYESAPEIYKQIQWLKMIEEVLEKSRKYVVLTDDKDTEVYIIDLLEKLTTSLYDLDLGLEEK